MCGLARDVGLVPGPHPEPWAGALHKHESLWRRRLLHVVHAVLPTTWRNETGGGRPMAVCCATYPICACQPKVVYVD